MSVTATGNALVIDLEALPTRGRARAVLEARIEDVGAPVRSVVGVGRDPHVLARFSHSARELGITIVTPKAGLTSGAAADRRAAAMRRTGRFENVLMFPGAVTSSARKLLLLDLENVGAGSLSEVDLFLERLLQAAGPVTGAVAAAADPHLLGAYKAACKTRGVKLVECKPGRDAADKELVKIARRRFDRNAIDAFVVASCDHIFSTLPGPYSVVTKERQVVAGRLVSKAVSVSTFRV